MNEEWRPIPGMEGRYEVSSLGRFRSVGRNAIDRAGRRRKVVGKVLTVSWTGHGLGVKLKDNNEKEATRSCAKLICRAFNGPSPGDDYETEFLDGNPRNLSAANLRWSRRAGNPNRFRSLRALGVL